MNLNFITNQDLSSYVKIDSFSVLVPFSAFHSLPSNLASDVYHVDSVTSEVIKTTRRQLLYTDRNMTSMKVSRKVTPNGEYILLFFSSKMLTNYGAGITMQSIYELENWLYSNTPLVLNDTLYNILLSRSHVYDLDLCFDFNMSTEEYDALLSTYRTIKTCREYKYRLNGSIKTAGIMFGVRESSTVKSPFLKIYTNNSVEKDKAFLLLNKENLVANTYFPHSGYSDDVLDTIRRCEVTIKNKAHFLSLSKSLCLPYDKMSSLLFVDKLTLQKYYLVLLSRHLNLDISTEKPKIKERESVVHNLLYLLLADNNITYKSSASQRRLFLMSLGIPEELIPKYNKKIGTIIAKR